MTRGAFSAKAVRLGLSCFACFAFFAFSVNVVSADQITIGQSLEWAFAYNPELKEAQEVRIGAEHRVDQAFGGYLPTIGIWAGAGFQQDSNYRTRNTELYGDIVSRAEVGVSFSQMLFDGGATPHAVGSSEDYHESAMYSVLDVATTLAYNTLSSHIDVIRRKKILDLAEQNVRDHEEILRLTRTRYNEGLSSSGDVDQVESRVQSAQATLLGHREGLEAALISYRRFTGQELFQELAAVFMPNVIFHDVDTVLNTAVQNNFQLRSLLSQVQGRMEERDGALAPFYPSASIDLAPSYATRDTSDDRDIFSWSAMVNMEWNLYNGGSDQANYMAQSASVRETRQNLHNTKDIIEQEIRTSFRRTVTAGEQSALYAAAARSSNDARANFYQQFQVGQRDLINVLDAATESFSASVAEVIANSDAMLGQYRLHALAGTLLEQLNINASPISTANPGEPQDGLVIPDMQW